MDSPELGQERVRCGQAEQLGQRGQTGERCLVKAVLTIGFKVGEEYESDTSTDCSKCKTDAQTSLGLKLHLWHWWHTDAGMLWEWESQERAQREVD